MEAPGALEAVDAALCDNLLQSDVTAIDEQEEQQIPQVVKSTVFPVPAGNVASLSLALGAVLPSLPKVLATNAPVNKLATAPRSNPTLPSQKKSHAPLCLVPSSKIKLNLDVQSQQQRPTNFLKKTSSKASAFPFYQMLPNVGRGFGEPRFGAGMRKATIVWFRNDLRVHDNEALATANKESLSVIPVYCFDPRDYGKSSSGFDKTGPYRAKFLLECVASLRDSLREKGSELIVRIGNPEKVLSTIAKSVGAEALFAHQEVSAEEINQEDRVTNFLKDEGIESKYFWGSTLFHVDDLPFKLEDMPSNYGGFREKVKNVSVRAAMDTPKQFKGLPSQGDVNAGDIPSLEDLGLHPVAATQEKPDPSTAKEGPLIGGEAEALKRLQKFSSEISSISKNKNSNNIYGASLSSKISPWLTTGCLSPRRMFEDLNKNNSSRVVTAAADSSSGMNWLIFELLWRDFFRFITKKYGAAKKTTPSPSPAFAT